MNFVLQNPQLLTPDLQSGTETSRTRSVTDLVTYSGAKLRTSRPKLILIHTFDAWSTDFGASSGNCC